jgi:hypothetical protein
VLSTPAADERTPSLAPPLPQVEHVPPPSVMPDLDNDHNDDTQLWSRGVDEFLALIVALGLVECELTEEMHTVSAEELASLEEVAHDPSWHTAMVEELRPIQENGT